MGSFLVLLHENPPQPDDNEDILAKIEEEFPEPDSYKFSDQVILISGPRLTTEVAKRLGFDDHDQRVGAILSLNGSFGGRSYAALWEWLRTADQPR